MTRQSPNRHDDQASGRRDTFWFLLLLLPWVVLVPALAAYGARWRPQAITRALPSVAWANYGRDEAVMYRAPLDLGIVRDILQDEIVAEMRYQPESVRGEQILGERLVALEQIVPKSGTENGSPGPIPPPGATPVHDDGPPAIHTPLPTVAPPTATPSPTLEPSPTVRMVTITLTPTPIPTATPTPMPIPTATPTDIPAPPAVPTSTMTPPIVTPTYTLTPTPMPTHTPKATYTVTPTHTPAPTYTPIPSPTHAVTPTHTPAPTYTPIPSPTHMLTPTHALTPTPTHTLTPTPTYMLTPSPTYTATATHTPTPSPTYTLTPTPTYTLTPSPTQTLIPSPTLTVTLTPTPTPEGCFDPIPPDGTLPDGFVADTRPVPGAQDVPTGLEQILVVYNQAMQDSEPGSVANLGRYTLTNQLDGEEVSFASAEYDPDTFTVVLGLRPSLQPLEPDTCYVLRIKSAVRNACNQMQGEDVLVEFCTAPSGSESSIPLSDVLMSAPGQAGGAQPQGDVAAWSYRAPFRALARWIRPWFVLLRG